jgi:hypothetical protein
VNLNRILISTTTDITVTFYVGGTPTSLDGAVSVNAVNTAGTVVISGGVGIPTGTAGEYRYKLTPTAGTGTLDTLTVVWAGLLNGDPETVTTRVEIVGGFVFTIAEARALSGLGGARSDINQDSSYKISTARSRRRAHGGGARARAGARVRDGPPLHPDDARRERADDPEYGGRHPRRDPVGDGRRDRARPVGPRDDTERVPVQPVRAGPTAGRTS